MTFLALTCPTCGGPLPPEAKKRAVVCAYCGAAVALDQWTARRRAFSFALESERRRALVEGGERVEVAGRSYRLLAPLSAGESSDVLLAERADGVREKVVLKILREPGNRERFTQTERALAALGCEERMVRRIPRLRHRGAALWQGQRSDALVLGYESGFFQTAWDVRENHGATLNAAHAVWIWRRVLDVLATAHRSGWLHRSILPHHVLLHARDHGALVAGWGASERGERPLDAQIPFFSDLYPEAVLQGATFTRAHDLAMSARCIGWLLRDDHPWHPARRTPSAFADLVVRVGSGAGSAESAEALDAELQRRARDAFGPPAYHHLEMPGWK